MNRTRGAIIIALSLITAPQWASAERWAGAWGYAPADYRPEEGESNNPPGIYRYRVQLTNAGDALRLTFSNAEGSGPLALGEIFVAAPATRAGMGIRADTVVGVRFGGKTGYTLPVGQSAISDEVPLRASAGQELIVSVATQGNTHPALTNLGMPMAFALANHPNTFNSIAVRPYLAMISVRNPLYRCTIVAFGDSITDGFLALSPTTRGWPGRLAERMASLPPGKRCGVVNMGISGNRVLLDGRSLAAVARFSRDVLTVPGVTHVVLLEGINDIGRSDADGVPLLDPEALSAGYRQIALQAHMAGLRIFGGTLMPFLPGGYSSPAKENVRQRVNELIRAGRVFDAVVDFDAATRDPQRPKQLRAAYDSGDHLHPNDAGYRAMGDAVNLSLFGLRHETVRPSVDAR